MAIYSAFICGEIKQNLSQSVKDSLSFEGFHTRKSMFAANEREAREKLQKKILDEISAKFEFELDQYLDFTFEEIEFFSNENDFKEFGHFDIGFVFY